MITFLINTNQTEFQTYQLTRSAPLPADLSRKDLLSVLPTDLPSYLLADLPTNSVVGSLLTLTDLPVDLASDPLTDLLSDPLTDLLSDLPSNSVVSSSFLTDLSVDLASDPLTSYPITR